ncbi:MAG: bifunctional YncE family protein/alkaline phosphatase family protein [Bacteroidales bacterium]
MKTGNFPALIMVLAVLLLGCSHSPKDLSVLSAPAGSDYTFIRKAGITVIPNGRLLTPAGVSTEVAPHPYGLAVSDDGEFAVTANSGVRPLSISIIKGLQQLHPGVLQVPPGPLNNAGILESVFMGLAISPDRQRVYVSGGQANKVLVFSVNDGVKIDSVDCSRGSDGQNYPDGYIGDMALTRDGRFLYAVDQTNFRLVVIDVQKRQVARSVKVGRYPFGVALSPDEKQVYVANVGMFEYKKIGSVEANKDYDQALKYPPFAYGSTEMKEGVTIGKVRVPGTGEPNVPESFSVWSVSVADIMHPRVVAKIKTGALVGDKVEGIPAVGGSSPNSMVCTSKYVFVSNGNNDNISVISLESNRVVKEIPLKLTDAVKNFRGVIPFGLAISPDQKRLFVAESGINAVGVVDIETLELIGHIPTGWFPSKLAVTKDGKKLIVANAKGYGSGPNGGKEFKAGPEGTYIGCLMKGTVSIIDVPSDAALKVFTQRVIRNNFTIERYSGASKARKDNPIPLYGGERESPVKYIVFISKENRTYDEVFGQLKKGRGDPTIARYGKGVSFTNKDRARRVEEATVMPNHLKLASLYSVSDNFYVDSDVSADGHRWLVNTYPNEWVEATVPASYGGNRTYKSSSKAPGSLGMTGSAGAIYPEDYNEAGSMWDHLERNGVDFFNFGFGVMFEPAFYKDTFKDFGIRYFTNYPMPAPMYTRTSRTYATFNMAIPDQFRITQFTREFNEKWTGPGKEMPKVLTVILPNDHGAGERPDAGYPFRESYMADNDLAVGRIVEFLSHTPYWKNMAIVITEDDAQNGVDHVDAHRSILMVISPYAKRDYVSHVHYSFGSLFKTFWNILGLPYLNQYDAGATDLSDMFTATPDFSPYLALPCDLRIFDPQKALTPLDEKFDWKALSTSPDIDNPSEMTEDQKEQEEYRTGDQHK